MSKDRLTWEDTVDHTDVHRYHREVNKHTILLFYPPFLRPLLLSHIDL